MDFCWNYVLCTCDRSCSYLLYLDVWSLRVILLIPLYLDVLSLGVILLIPLYLDVWSLGVILFMMVCGRGPFSHANDSETLDHDNGLQI